MGANIGIDINIDEDGTEHILVYDDDCTYLDHIIVGGIGADDIVKLVKGIYSSRGRGRLMFITTMHGAAYHPEVYTPGHGIDPPGFSCPTSSTTETWPP